MKHIVSDEKSAVEYIQMILNEWEVWQTHHTGLVEAMKILLSANKNLTDEVDRLNLSLSATTERSESRKEADVSEILELRLKIEQIFEEIEKEIELALKSNYKVLPQIEQSEEMYNRVQGKIDALRGIEYFIAELKKKYTEGK